MTSEKQPPVPYPPRNILTSREKEVLQLLAEGWTAPEIGNHVNLSSRTVEHHVQNMRLKLNAQSAAHLITRAVSTGVLKVVRGSVRLRAEAVDMNASAKPRMPMEAVGRRDEEAIKRAVPSTGRA